MGRRSAITFSSIVQVPPQKPGRSLGMRLVWEEPGNEASLGGILGMRLAWEEPGNED